MTARRALVALLARLFPGRGGHHHTPGPDDTVVFPRIPPGQDQDWPSACELTQLDMPPARDRPYVDRGDEGGPGGFRWLP